MWRRLSIYVPLILALGLIVVIGAPLIWYMDWRESQWRDDCRAQGGHPAQAAYDSSLVCLDSDDRIVWVRR